MQRALAFFAGIGVGAGLVYLLDPAMARRRKLAVDQAMSAGHDVTQLGDAVQGAARDVRNRAQDVAAETRQRGRSEPVDDRTLAERVRAELGRILSYAGAIDVSPFQGRVTLRGPILRSDVDRLVSAVNGIPGIEAVDNQMDVHDEPGNISALQGAAQRH